MYVRCYADTYENEFASRYHFYSSSSWGHLWHTILHVVKKSMPMISKPESSVRIHPRERAYRILPPPAYRGNAEHAAPQPLRALPNPHPPRKQKYLAIPPPIPGTAAPAPKTKISQQQIRPPSLPQRSPQTPAHLPPLRPLHPHVRQRQPIQPPLHLPRPPPLPIRQP